MFTPSLVRGLSYYTGPIWEIRAPGAPGSIGGGGRYDHLIEALGGPDMPAVGSSIGVERVLSLLPGAAVERGRRLDVAVTSWASELAAAVVRAGRRGPGGGAAGQRVPGFVGQARQAAAWASDQGARWCLIYGAREQEAGLVTVRDMVSREEPARAVPPGEEAGVPGRGRRAARSACRRSAAAAAQEVVRRRRRRAVPGRGRRPGALDGGRTAGTLMLVPASAASDVVPASRMPHGTNRSYHDRSLSQLSAMPCMVTPRATRMPTAPILRSGRPSGPRIQAPLRPSTRSA